MQQLLAFQRIMIIRIMGIKVAHLQIQGLGLIAVADHLGRALADPGGKMRFGAAVLALAALGADGAPLVRIVFQQPAGVGIIGSLGVNAGLVRQIINIKAVAGVALIYLILRAADVQLAHQRRFVALLSQIIGQHLFVFRQNIKQVIHAVAGHGFARHHAGAAGRTYGGVAVAMLVHGSLAAQAIQIGGTDIAAAVNAQAIAPLLIRCNEHNVWFHSFLPIVAFR